MFVIGERINGMFTETRKAIEKRDKAAIHKLADNQLRAGANALDVNVGPTKGKPVENMCWLVETVQEATDAPICIDTPKFDVMSGGPEGLQEPGHHQLLQGQRGRPGPLRAPGRPAQGAPDRADHRRVRRAEGR